MLEAMRDHEQANRVEHEERTQETKHDGHNFHGTTPLSSTNLTNRNVLAKSAASAGSRTETAGLGRPSHARSMRADQVGSSVAFAHAAPARFEPGRPWMRSCSMRQ